MGCGLPVVITIDGKPALWGSPQRGLSPSEREEYEELHARHRAEDQELHRFLGSADATFRKAIHRETGAPVDAARISKIERLYQSIELTRRTLRPDLADPDVSLEWAWRFWVGRELAETWGGHCIEIIPGQRSVGAWHILSSPGSFY